MNNCRFLGYSHYSASRNSLEEEIILNGVFMNSTKYTESKTNPQDNYKSFAKLKMHVSQTDWLNLLSLSFWCIFKLQGITLFVL